MADGIEPLQVLEFGANRAWRVNVAAALEAAGKSPEGDATVSSWVIQAPWAHPVWSSYWLLLIHLRPLTRDGEPFQEPRIYLEGATHELILHAVNPDYDAEQEARSECPHYLTPSNFAVQLKLESDEAAVQLAEATARDVLEARINPDTDALRQWIDRFGDNMVREEFR